MTNHYPNEQDAEMKAKARKPKSKYVAQEGGDHYQAEYQHWDWVRDVGLGYLAGCATKYVSRWWKKNGLQDLLKARTYVEKMIVSGDTSVKYPKKVDEINYRFVTANKLPTLETEFCCAMVFWEGPGQLEYNLEVLDRLIDLAKRAKGQGQAPAAATLAATPGDVATAPADGRFLASKGQAVGHHQQAANVARHEQAIRSFGPCPCGCGEPRSKNKRYASEECAGRMSARGMEHPFGYDDWHEGGFSTVNITKTDEGYNG